MAKAPTLDLDLLLRMPQQQGHVWKSCWELAAGALPCKASMLAMAGNILEAEVLGSGQLAAYLAR